MRLFTNSEQTAKLIELGFDKPKGLYYPNQEQVADGIYMSDFPITAYSIGELISFLPEEVKTTYERVISANEVYYYSWVFNTYTLPIFNQHQDELIDNLFDMCVRLKEEEVI